MKRREFLSSAGAAAVLPVLPLPAIASPTAVASANAAQVGWAALFARVNDRATPALIQKWMGVGPEQANALMSELVKRNIIHAPIAGSATSVQPMYPRGGVPGIAKSSGQILRKARDMLDTLADLDEHDAAPEEDVDETP
ncbi:hypothetical protein L0664_09845 [Octadecabacter sp. G9-8]|uniref:Uncharacterized protein n=1 Tax=Octadecabacter dasysiphoniae TaxID=2909341 RepID=A0ABS9CY84_9RHOB|nr:hypothetical protein [Octadecabacter dasysiphoniae]MCF2871365.1 hypothetical protein [Octadecabacter dasysiphoniae]